MNETRFREFADDPSLALASYARGLAFENLTPEAVIVVKHCLLDFLGVSLAGRSEPIAQILLASVLAEGSREEATLIGTRRKASASNAALYNGAVAHAL